MKVNYFYHCHFQLIWSYSISRIQKEVGNSASTQDGVTDIIFIYHIYLSLNNQKVQKIN